MNSRRERPLTLGFCILSTVEVITRDVFRRWLPRAQTSEYKINSTGHETGAFNTAVPLGKLSTGFTVI